MAFDAGVTQEAWNFAIAAWVAYARKRDRMAGVLTTLTFLAVLVLLMILAGSSFLYSLGL